MHEQLSKLTIPPLCRLSNTFRERNHMNMAKPERLPGPCADESEEVRPLQRYSAQDSSSSISVPHSALSCSSRAFTPTYSSLAAKNAALSS